MILTRARPTTLLLFTESFPFDAALEGTFLGPELPYLARAFDRVIVVPRRLDGARSPVLGGIEVDEGLADNLRANRTLAGRVARLLTSAFLRDDVTRQPVVLTRRASLARLISASNIAGLTRGWFADFLSRRGLDSGTCVAYTFWCDPVTTGIGMAKTEFPDLVVVSRAHGADLYADRYDPPYLPARIFTLQRLDRLLPDSDQGVRYVTDHHPWFAPRCEVARLGVDDPGFVVHPSDPGRFVIISCSRMVEIKRVDRILNGVVATARSKPHLEFEWHHFGDGPLKTTIEQEAARILPPNAIAEFPGYSSVDELFAFYRDHPVDVFVNASESEGTPVSIMEAISCGLPIVATAVGGNPEIVSSNNGVLVSPRSSPDELRTAFTSLIDNPELARSLSLGSREVWRNRYDAASNHSAFANLLVRLRSSV